MSRRRVHHPMNQRSETAAAVPEDVTGINSMAALRGALVGWAGMTGMMVVARKAGMTTMSIIEIEGSLVAKPSSTMAKVVGFVAHLGMSIAIGFAYAFGYKLLGWRPNWKTGAAGGLIHWSIATMVTGIVSAEHPKRNQLPMPGFGGIALGPKSAAGFFMGHLVYGTLFGWQYGRGEH